MKEDKLMAIIESMAEEFTSLGEFYLGERYLKEARSYSEDRITRDVMFITMAHTVAKRSTCRRAHVGALIIKEHRVISIGYNGSEPGEPHCYDVGCLQINGSGCQRTIHAEDNAIRFAKKLGQSVEGATLYCTHSPCTDCAKIISEAKIGMVVYDEWYHKGAGGIEILSSHGIEVRCHGAR